LVVAAPATSDDPTAFLETASNVRRMAMSEAASSLPADKTLLPILAVEEQAT
jgi:hypothetical protein